VVGSGRFKAVNVLRIIIALLTIAFVLVSALACLDSPDTFVALLAVVCFSFGLVNLSYGHETEHDPIRAFLFRALLATRAPPVL
jgi:hypothetical protein